ncbi:hypothetical protein BLNAU_1457 [Blattamonas nauphoetae]|uniref:Uncharacterized protein n=1 Tax=Blattamonas nauphoetae TaxID=2049346 RepID=A0ABQ9YI25_9EUKA|nr:hypothetical protein BLNAU_1457 [Blattamonas nauphoetae]
MRPDTITLLSTLFAIGHQSSDKPIPPLVNTDKPYVFFLNHINEPGRSEVSLSVEVAKEEAQRITDQLSHFILEKGEKETVESEEEKSVQLVPIRPPKRKLEKEEEDQEQNEDTSEIEGSSESDLFEGEEKKTAEEKGKENQKKRMNR